MVSNLFLLQDESWRTTQLVSFCRCHMAFRSGTEKVLFVGKHRADQPLMAEPGTVCHSDGPSARLGSLQPWDRIRDHVGISTFPTFSNPHLLRQSFSNFEKHSKLHSLYPTLIHINIYTLNKVHNAFYALWCFPIFFFFFGFFMLLATHEMDFIMPFIDC